MTREELKEAFNTECTEADATGNAVIKRTPADMVNWIADKFCSSGDDNAAPLFSKAFTGMHDKNKKPIHEGDTVRVYYKGEYTLCRVIYDIKHAAFFIRWPDGYVNQYFMNGSNYEVVDSDRR